MKNIRDSIIEAHITEDTIKYFSVQVFVVAMFLGLKFSSWALFGISFFVPLIVYMLSGKFNICRFISIALCFIYILLWGFVGFTVGFAFSLSAAIVLCLFFLIPGICYNLCAFEYFKGN